MSVAPEPARSPARILVVEDEPAIRDVVAAYLTREGYQVSQAGDGVRALELARTELPDLVVLDLMLPGVDGIEVCRQLRTFSDAYVVMLTARAEEVDKLIGLSVGADDYMTKPFSPRELTARVKARLRRPRGPQDESTARVFGELIIDPQSREVTLGGVPVALTRTEFDILDALSAAPRRAFSRHALITEVWGPDWYGDDHLADVHIAHIRAKLGEPAAAPRYILTVRGVGYRMGPQ